MEEKRTLDSGRCTFVAQSTPVFSLQHPTLPDNAELANEVLIRAN